MGFTFGSTFRLDDTGDVVITQSNDLSLVTEYDKIVQDLSVLLKSQKYQYLFRPEYGVDYKSYLADKSLSRFLNTDVFNALSEYYFIDTIDSLTATTSGLKMNITADLTLLNGEKITITVVV
mgnify:CR=1 FL=1